MSELVDENAFGLFISQYDVESVEYGLEPEQFVERIAAFEAAVKDELAGLPVSLEARAVDLGHAFLIEYAEPEELWDPVPWLRALRARLSEQGIESVGVISHGSRWVPREPDALDDRQLWIGAVSLTRATRMSEPLRRALHADSAAQPDDGTDGAPGGWGPGLYLDTEALDALGRKLKNAPTPLSSAGATFYRLTR